jgi:CHASE2 domain-containing sensor protein
MAILLDLENYMLPCMNKQIFGIECPGCGIQRSVSLLLDGNFIDALKIYPAIFTIILLVGFIGASLLFNIKNSFKIKIYLLYLNAGIIIISYVYKMVHLIH